MKKSAKITLVSLLMVGAFVYLMVLGIKEGSMYYLEVSEFTVKMEELGNTKVRINGEVLKGSNSYNTETHIFSFTLKDTENPEIVKVEYKGAPPDLVDEKGITIVAEGRYDKRRGIFVSDKLLVKCPSKYEKEGGSA